MPNPPPDESAEERRARELAETVKEEANAVSETVREEAGGVTDHAEQRAADLAAGMAAERVIQRTEERVEARSDIKGELRDITEAVAMLVEHMDRSLPEERVAAILDGAKEEEKRSRRRLAVSILGPLIIVGAIAAGSWNQARVNNEQNADIAVVADYVRNCLQHPERLTPAEKAEQCGTDNSAEAIRGLLKAINCSLLIDPAARTQALLDDCVKQALG